MNDSVVRRALFEIAARRSRLPAALRAALDKPPSWLPPGPHGSLAD